MSTSSDPHARVPAGVAGSPAARSGGRLALLALALITIGGGFLRFYGLAWGAPYYHFHIDEHFVFSGAEMLRRSVRDAALSPKFFMYSPLPMYVLNVVRAVYEHLAHPLVLTVPRDEVTYMILGRAISAALGTATIPLVYMIARWVAGRPAGLVAALLLASGVLHLRESHFFTVDVSLTFFSVLTWLCVVALARNGRARSRVSAGLALGGAVLCKYSAVFLAPLIVVTELCVPRSVRPDLRTLAGWRSWVVRAAIPGLVAVAVFLALDPMVVIYHAKFRQDIVDWVTSPLSGAWRPIWAAQFTDIETYSYWFTNVLWWGLGPAFEIWGLLGVAWLLWRRDRLAVVTALFPIAYFLTASRTVTPFARYGVVLVPALAVSAGVLSADLIARPRWRKAAIAATGTVVTVTALYAAAYMHVFAAPDSRLAASRYLARTVPAGAAILVEPSHNIPPMGSYLTNTDFYRDYVMWGAQTERQDYYRLYTLDTYVYLYNPRINQAQKHAYIQSRLALVNYIVMDDTFLQFYQHLPEAEYGVVKRYYRDLFAGRLGFALIKTFKVYPSLFGFEINDDRAELSFRLFDHPRVFIFKRAGQAVGG